MDGAAIVTFRLCVDLNVWISQFLSDARGLRGTTTQRIVQIVQDGRAPIGPVQLVISHAMLTRLQDVLVRHGASPDTSGRYIALVATFARLGPAPAFPTLVLGGGVQPTRDAIAAPYDPYDPGFEPEPYDPEDGRVLDTALAGRAHALVTADFRDFVQDDDRVVLPGRLHGRRTAAGDLWIVRPPEMLRWLGTGEMPS